MEPHMLRNLFRFPIAYYRRWRDSRSLSEVARVMSRNTAIDKLKMVEFSHSGIWVHVLDGRKFRWDVGTPNSLLTIPKSGVYEGRESAFIRTIVKPGMTAVDCGANFGWYTTLLAQCVGESGAVHSFEPIPEVFELLKENLRANSLDNRVHANNFALGESEGLLKMLIPLRQGKGTPFASFKKQTWGKHRTLEVRVNTLMKYCQEQALSSVNFIKCDVEGAELLVMKGAEPLFVRGDRPAMMLELVESSMQPFGFTRKDAYDLLAVYGYVPHYIDEKGTPVPIRHYNKIQQQNIFFLTEAQSGP